MVLGQPHLDHIVECVFSFTVGDLMSFIPQGVQHSRKCEAFLQRPHASSRAKAHTFTKIPGSCISLDQFDLMRKERVRRFDLHCNVDWTYVNTPLFFVGHDDPYEVRIPGILKLWKDPNLITFF